MNCSCPIIDGMDFEDLRYIITSGQMCTSKVNTHICVNLDRELRKADGERMRRAYYQKRLRKEGLTPEEIKNNPPRRRGQSKGKSYEALDLDLG